MKLRDQFCDFTGYQKLSTLITYRSKNASERMCLRKKKQTEVREKEGGSGAGRLVLVVLGHPPGLEKEGAFLHLRSLSYRGLRG